MSRARSQSGPTISLFPFLAVLLCTMGALLVLLVLFSRSARQGDTAAAADRREAERQAREELEAARDELAWRIDQLREVRDRTADELAKARMQLAGTEEDARRLADELDALGQTAEALVQAAADDTSAEAILELERRLAAAEQALDEAKEAAAAKPPAYAVVPFEGPTGTHRRPLYIECCIDGVFLQPEGIRLGPADFEGPPGPGNPLASALRAAREHIARSPGESGDPNVQPYPLLLVRPSGVMAYYAARESIQSWGSEFGYQFIDEEWTLTFPPRDVALAEAELRAVEEARRRLEWLAQVRPTRKPVKPATQYRAATTRGGVVSSSGPSVLGDQSRFDWTEEQAGGGGAAGGPGRGFVAGGAGGSDGDGATGRGDAGDVILGDRSGSGSSSAGGQGTMAAGGGGRLGGAGGDGEASTGEFAAVGSRYSGPSKFYASSGAGDGPGGPASGDGTQPGGDAASGGGSGTGSTRGGSSTAAGGPTAAAGGASSGGSAAGQQAGGSSGGGGAEGLAGSAGGASGGGGSGPSMPGLHQPGGGASAAGMSGASAGAAASLAGRRGSNWASLATHDNPVPLTRPIKVECSAAEFRILGDGGRVQSRVPIGTHTIDSVDPLVREVHATVGGWGLAGDRMYWKPELVLSATPDGAGRREDLEKLLADSGMDTRRSEHRDKVRNLPPVQRTGGLFPRR